jgi:WhiB family redox-sensing transcriptional regulator
MTATRMSRERARVDILLARGRNGEDMSWHERAACAGAPWPDAWFPAVLNHRRQWDEARAVCNACPVRTECLDYALAADEREGMWGGLSPEERKRLRKERAA